MLKTVLRRHIAGILLLSLCWADGLAAQGAENNEIPLLVVWPPAGARVDADRIRVGGRTDSAATVTVNGKPFRVFASGAFAGTCPLKIGENTIIYRATKNGRSVTATRRVFRSKPLRTLPKTPLRFDPDYEGLPSEDLEVRPGDVIRIRVKGSPGWKATFRIGSGRTHYPLFETSNGSVRGFYEGAYTVKPTDRFVRARITCYLAKKGNAGKPAARVLLPTHITVKTMPFPDTALVKDDYTELRAGPSGGAPLAMARGGSYLNVVGSFGDRVRVALSPSRHAWVYRSQIDLAAGESPCRRGVIRDIDVREDHGATVIRIPLGLRVPFIVTEPAGGSAIELTLFGVENRLNWITDRTNKGMVETVVAAPTTDGTARFLVSLRQAGLLGYRGYYQGTDFLLALRPMPVAADPDRPLAGRTVLLDPGHGGSSRGTVGSTGLEEKTINLKLCELLRQKLEYRGARVVLTRSKDVDVSLADRARRAETEPEGDLFVSIHNNSISLTQDPLAARGVGVFYYHPHSHGVARAIFRRMLEADPPPRPYGVVRADFHVCREITCMPSVLVECLFLSNPEDEMLLLDKAFGERYMETVAMGIEDWFASVEGGPPAAVTTGAQ